MKKNKLLFGLLGIFLLLSIYGCAALLLGAGAVSGVAVSKDTSRLAKDVSFNRAWEISRKLVSNMGVINLEDKKAGRIEANIKDSKVIIICKQLTPKTIQLEVKARKNMFPNIDLAIEIINAINSKL